MLFLLIIEVFGGHILTFCTQAEYLTCVVLVLTLSLNHLEGQIHEERGKNHCRQKENYMRTGKKAAHSSEREPFKDK